MSDAIAEGWSFFKGRGYSDAATAGILGNLLQENASLDPRAVHDGGTGIGIAGWRDPSPGKGRKTALLNYAKEKGLDPYARATQFAYLDHELRTSEFATYKRLAAVKSPEEGALAMISFERPQGWTAANPTGGHGWSNRRNNAMQVFGRMTGAGGAIQAGAPAASAQGSSVGSGSQPALPELPGTGNPVGVHDVNPTNPYTTTEEQQQRNKAQETASGFFGAAAESAWDASPIKWVWQGMEDVGTDPDFSWEKNRELLNEVTQGLPNDTWEAFERATSEKHARIIRKRIEEQLDLRQRIAAGGWSARVGAFLGEMLEPVGLTASFIAPEIAGVAKMGRLKSIVVGSTSAAAMNVALELPRHAIKETAEDSDILMAAGAGLVLGGAFGALRRNPATQLEANAMERVGKGFQRAGTEQLPGPHAAPSGSAGAMAMPGRETLHPETHAWFDETLDAPETALGSLRFDSVGQLKSSQSPVARAVGGKLGLDAVGNKDRSKAVDFTASEFQRHTHEGMMAAASKEFMPAFKEYLKETGTTWADRGPAEVAYRSKISDYIRNKDPARASEFPASVVRMGDKLRALTKTYQELLIDPGRVSGRTLDPVPGFENLKPDPNYMMRQVDHQKVFASVKRFGDAQVADAYAKGIRAMNPELSPELATKIAKGYVKRLHELSAGVDFKGDRAVSGFDAHAIRELLEEFDGLSAKEVDMVVDALTPKKASDAGVSARAKHRMLFDEGFAQKLTVTDRADPRFGQQMEFRLKDLFEDDAMAVFENYSRQASGLIGLHQVHIRNPRFTPDHVRPMSRAGVEIREVQRGADILTEAGELGLRVSGRSVLIDAATFKNASPEAVRPLLEAAVDYAASRGLRLVSGKSVNKQLAAAFESLRGDYKVTHNKKALKNAAADILERHDGKPIYEVRGEWKAPDNEPEYLVKGLSKEADWNRMVERLTQTWDDVAGSGKVSHEARLRGLEKDVQNLNFLRNQILGRTDKVDQTAAGRMLRRLRDYNFLRLMNNVGLAQLNEFAMVTSSVGLKASLSAMPAFKSLLRNARTGELDDVLAREIEYITNYGTDWVRGSLRTVSDDFGNPINSAKMGNLGERYDAVVEKAKRGVSAISGMAGINTALQRFAARAVYAKFAYMADGMKPNYQRLAVMGINKDMADRIFKSIREHRTYIEGASGKMDLPRMNLEKWADKEAAAHFQMGVTRWSQYAVLANDPGQMSRVMGTWFGKTVFQFRSFVMGAWSRHLLHNIHMNDWQTAGTFLFTGFTGALLHIAHSHLSTLGRSDRDKMLEKRLSWKSLVLNGWARSSYSSFLPAGIDTMGSLVGADPLFTRVSGQATDAVLGNPTIGLLNDVGAGVRGITTSIWDSDNEISQADVRNLMKAFPYQNWLPFQALMSTMIRPLPEFDPKGPNRR